MLLGISVGVFFISYAVINKDSELRSALLSQAQSIDLALGWSSMYASIETSADQSTETSKRIAALAELSQQRARISKICAVTSNCRAVYLMRLNAKNQIIFLIDSLPESSKLFIQPGTVYTDASAKLYQVFASQEMTVDGPYKDRWGVWTSAFVPHQLPDGSTVVVGIDVEASRWNELLWRAALTPILATLAFLVLIVFYHFLWRSKSKQNEDLKQSHRELLKLSHEDNLTGLPNRRFFDDRLEQAIAEAGRTNDGFAVMYLDLDHFKQVNDTLGHHAGDELLQIVADKLLVILRAEDTVARLSGDEFAILLPRIHKLRDVESVALEVILELGKPVILQDNQAAITVSIGIALYSKDFSTSYLMLKAADEALYVAKTLGKNRYYAASKAESEAMSGNEL